jgi:hypothetical protein
VNTTDKLESLQQRNWSRHVRRSDQISCIMTYVAVLDWAAADTDLTCLVPVCTSVDTNRSFVKARHSFWTIRFYCLFGTWSSSFSINCFMKRVQLHFQSKDKSEPRTNEKLAWTAISFYNGKVVPCIMNHHAMKAYVAFLISGPAGSEWSVSRPGHFTRWTDTQVSTGQ